MTAFELPYTTTEEGSKIIHDLRREYSSVVRFAYNRFTEGKKEKEVRSLCRGMNGIKLLNSWLMQCAVLEGRDIHTRNIENATSGVTGKIIFGGKKTFELRKQGKITKEEFQDRRLRFLCTQGERLHKGNRMFDFSQLREGKLVLKVNRHNHIVLEIPHQRKNYRRKMDEIVELSMRKELTVSVRMNGKSIHLTYEEPVRTDYNPIKNRYVGIDLNPNHVGVAVMEDDRVLHVRSFDVFRITKKITSNGESSDSPRSKYLNNKLDHEILEISKEVGKIVEEYRVAFIFLEDLDGVDFGNSGKGRRFNRITRNLWKRKLFEGNLKKRMSILGVRVFSVNPVYTSIIGNLQHEYFDPCNAACEVARRGYEVIIKKSKKFYPDFSVKDTIPDLWKKQGMELEKDWKGVFGQIKNAKLRYRVPLEDVVHRSLQMKSKHSKVLMYICMENL